MWLTWYPCEGYHEINVEQVLVYVIKMISLKDLLCEKDWYVWKSLKIGDSGVGLA